MHVLTKEGWRYYKMTKTIEVIYEKGVFKP
ncbi:MAG: antitoxin family protein, partial [Methanosarcinales archaeon]|nr:antitoxin family protein [Methanosarcinales archaeon]